VPVPQALLSRLAPIVKQGELDELAHPFCRAVFKHLAVDGERDMRQTLSDEGPFGTAKGLFDECPYRAMNPAAGLAVGIGRCELVIARRGQGSPA
jgi:hypothetical protein